MGHGWYARYFILACWAPKEPRSRVSGGPWCLACQGGGRKPKVLSEKPLHFDPERFYFHHGWKKRWHDEMEKPCCEQSEIVLSAKTRVLCPGKKNEMGFQYQGKFWQKSVGKFLTLILWFTKKKVYQQKKEWWGLLNSALVKWLPCCFPCC